MLDAIKERIKAHMDAQPYMAICEACSNDIKLIVEIDNDLDMTVTVPVCDCQTKDNES
jgi:hypothetical protein